MELTEEELAAKIKESTEAAIAAAAIEADKALKAKNTELLGKLAKFKEVDPEEYKQTLAKLKEIEDAKLTEAEKAEQRRAERLKKEAAKDMELATLKADLAKEKKGNAIANAIRDAGAVNEGMGDAVALLIKDRITTSDTGAFMIGDKPVADYVAEWRKEEGKGFFVPANSGGGGQGSSSVGGNDQAKYFKRGPDWNLTKQAALRKSSPDLAKQLAEQGNK